MAARKPAAAGVDDGGVDPGTLDHGDGLHGIGLHDLGHRQSGSPCQMRGDGGEGGKPRLLRVAADGRARQSAGPLPCATRSQTTRQSAAASAATAAVAAVMLPVHDRGAGQKPGRQVARKGVAGDAQKRDDLGEVAEFRALAWLSTAQASCRARLIPSRAASASAASAMPGSRSGQGVKGASS